MNYQFSDILKKMELLMQGQNGNLNGGFLSITNGRYRLVITDQNPGNPQYSVTNRADKCTNESACGGSTNTKNCHNMSYPACSNTTDSKICKVGSSVYRGINNGMNNITQ
jgi:hypothetical protein